MNNGSMAASVAYDETQTQLEKTTLLPAAAGLFILVFVGFPLPLAPPLSHQAGPGAVGPGEKEKTCQGHRLIYLQYFHYINTETIWRLPAKKDRLASREANAGGPNWSLGCRAIA
ncbi:hypothetical protein LP419_35325 [Massilia sp. H-1]|nr:hypothetical protein LP419_35325 [Massilia sp. H-1]